MTGHAAAISGAVRTAARPLFDLLLPGVCQACRAEPVAAEGLCSQCSIRLLELVSLPYCPRCGATIGPNIPIFEDGCWQCPVPLFRFRRVVRLGPYAPPLRRVIQGLKYHHTEVMRPRLGRLLAQAVQTACAADEMPFDLVLPVPMHWRRRLWRGYDHARVLAREVARRMDGILGDELIRTRNTPPQVHFSRTQRIRNVRGAFKVIRTGGVEGANVLLIDDVTTTGATANEAARTVLAAGASRVTLAVIAKAERPLAIGRRAT